MALKVNRVRVEPWYPTASVFVCAITIATLLRSAIFPPAAMS